MAIILIDLDRFKLLNDNYGHLVGDRFLKHTAAILRRAVHLDGVVGRYGGDEFLIVLSHANRERAQNAALRIQELMQHEKFRPHPLVGAVPFSFSMGIAIYPEHGHNAAELIAYADSALYSQKKGGYNIVELARKIESDYAHYAPSYTGGVHEGGLFSTLFSLVVAVDRKDSYTKFHSEHVAEWAARLAAAVKLPAEVVRALEVAGLLHDVGKIGVPDAILKKPGPLSAEEYDIMKGHVILSERLIQELPFQDTVLEAVSCHHERWDGTGYPRQRIGPEMPLVGRIMAVADAYSAMCLDRPYRIAMTNEDIFAQLRAGAGIQFDPDLVEPFIAAVKEHLETETNIAPVEQPKAA